MNLTHVSRPSYAGVAATLALVVALGGGGAYAAGLAHNSVKSPQIKNGAVKAQDLAAGAVTSGQVSDGSLTGADIDESTLVLPPAPVQPAVFAGKLSTDETVLNGKTFVNVASLTYTAPANGYAYVHAAASFAARGTPGAIWCEVLHDTTQAGAIYWEAGDVDGPPMPGPAVDQRQSAEAVFPVTKGTHTVTLNLRELQPGNPTPTWSSAFASQVIVEFFPTGAVAP